MGTGGSRYGAGRPGWRRKCEQMNRLDVRYLNNHGRLHPGQYFSWSWSRGDEPCGTIGIRTAEDHIQLIYTWTPSGEEPRSMDYPVWVEHTPCNFGGTRPWFRCPRCQWRHAILYGVASNDGRFGCRNCMRLGYSSEAESPMDRLWRKQRKLEAKLIEGEVKPKHMRWRTYEKLCEKIDGIEEEKDFQFAIGAWSILRRTGKTIDDFFND